MLEHDPAGPVLLAGGSGVVGRVLAPLVARLERRSVLVASRDAGRAAPVLAVVAAAGGEAGFLPYLVGNEPSASVSVVVGLVNDPGDMLLQQAVAARVPYVDVTRWTSRLAVALGRLALVGSSSPVVLASGWMGGLLARVARALSQAAPGAVSVEGAIPYALADASGADSVDYLDRLWIPFEVPGGGRAVEPFRDRRTVVVDGHRTAVYRLDTPEQWTLPLSLGLPAEVGLGFDGAWAGKVLSALVRLGFFRRIRGDRFRRLRHGLLRAPGAERRAGARSAFRVDVRFADGTARSRTLVGSGQAQLTAAGAWLAIRQALTAPAGVHLPEQDPDAGTLFSERLPAAGIAVVDEAAA